MKKPYKFLSLKAIEIVIHELLPFLKVDYEWNLRKLKEVQKGISLISTVRTSYNNEDNYDDGDDNDDDDDHDNDNTDLFSSNFSLLHTSFV